MYLFVINKNQLNKFLSTLNFVLAFVGFQLATSMFLPAVSDMEGVTLRVTIPYRALTLLLSFIVMILNVKTPINRISLPLIAFLFYWTILIIRIFYDLVFRTDIHVVGTSQVWFYIFLICIPGFFSIFVSYQNINLDKAYWWILSLTALTMVLTLFSNQALLVGSDEANSRTGGNAAISTIAFGHFGTTSIILGLFTIFKKNYKLYLKFLSIPLIILGMFCMLRAGSRGPVMALVIVLFFWAFARQKNIVFSVLNLIFVALLTIIFLDYILTLIGSVSPIIEERLRVTIYEGSTGGRDPYYSSAFNAFLDSPVWGKQFALFFPDGSFDYSHNLVLDALMGMGLIGGIVLLFFIYSSLKISFYGIKWKNKHFWIFLLLIQQIVFNMLSGSFYFNPILSVLLVFIFVKFSDYSVIEIHE